jgi:DNA-binding NtrC family response regulator
MNLANYPQPRNLNCCESFKHKLSHPLAIECFRRYHWPGNIRELRNVVERSVTLARGPTIEIGDLPPQLRGESAQQRDATSPIDLAEVSRDEALDNADRAYLNQLLTKHKGVIASAARQAGLSRQGMNKLLKRHGIDADDFRILTMER